MFKSIRSFWDIVNASVGSTVSVHRIVKRVAVYKDVCRTWANRQSGNCIKWVCVCVCAQPSARWPSTTWACKHFRRGIHSSCLSNIYTHAYICLCLYALAMKCRLNTHTDTHHTHTVTRLHTYDSGAFACRSRHSSALVGFGVCVSLPPRRKLFIFNSRGHHQADIEKCISHRRCGVLTIFPSLLIVLPRMMRSTSWVPFARTNGWHTFGECCSCSFNATTHPSIHYVECICASVRSSNKVRFRLVQNRFLNVQVTHGRQPVAGELNLAVRFGRKRCSPFSFWFCCNGLWKMVNINVMEQKYCTFYQQILFTNI